MQNFLSPRAIALSTLAIGATALSGCSAQGYGHGTQYAGENCNALAALNCGRYGGSYQAQASHTAPVLRESKSRYGSDAVSHEQYAYAQPQMMLSAAPQMSYQQPTYQTPSYTAPTTSYTAVAADCPAGTTAQTDGTCLQGSSYSYSTAAVSAPTYFPTTSSYSSSSYMSGGTTANCPAGTSAQSDGTCLEGSSSSLSYSSSSYSTPSYSSPSYNSSSSIAPPISTHDFSDYNWGSNDTTWGSAGYVSPGTRTVDSPNSYPAASTPSYSAPSPSYWPTRK